ncbi:6-phosphogluconolactonase [Vogesella facilis]|uniref:6-phosphogluconolactonase n=1 Tax=Vogesella facilis TaxID=1655232 RepID=A0ABV7RK07_9NEIS
MNLHAFASAAEASAALAQAVATDLAAAIAARGQAVLAVSGGRSPVPFLQALAAQDIPWQQVTVTLVDERVVAPDHADSNAGLVREHLLQGRAAVAAFLPLVNDGADAAAELAAAAVLWRTPDVTVLGMGEDGHTASLFPAASNLTEGLAAANPAALLVVVPPAAPAAPHTRISMTLAELQRSGKLYLAIAGETKRRVLDNAAAAVSDTLPISHLLSATARPLDVYWSA